jgi:hypothetical protein
MKRTPIVVLVIALIAGFAALPAQADVGYGQFGRYSLQQVTCYFNPQYPHLSRVVVQAPLMSSAAVNTNGWVFTGGVYGGGHVQQVGYEAYLYRWNGSQWVYIAYGGLKLGQTGDVLQPVGWHDGFQGGTTAFPSFGRGHYSVALRYRWYANQFTAGGTVEGWAPPVYTPSHSGASNHYCSF